MDTDNNTIDNSIDNEDIPNVPKPKANFESLLISIEKISKRLDDIKVGQKVDRVMLSLSVMREIESESKIPMPAADLQSMVGMIIRTRPDFVSTKGRNGGTTKISN